MTFKRILITGGSGFIGTNLIEELLSIDGVEILNLDLLSPKLNSHRSLWRLADVRDAESTFEVVDEYRPDAVIHLAARTDLDGLTLADYSSNVEGTASLLEALHRTGFKGHAIFTSSMYVCEPGYLPASDEDYNAHTVYGQSKCIGEQLVRRANPTYPWVITRPTSIWGPWFGVPYRDFFKLVLRKRYVNISGNRTRKTYGYIGNTVRQIRAVMDNCGVLDGKVVYLGDWPPYVINDWAEEIAAFVPYHVKRIPHTVMSLLALTGDVAGKLGARLPMTSFRLHNMTTDNVHNLALIQDLMDGKMTFSREEGNQATIAWLRAEADAG